ncbi:MAG: DUF305 domain-containing protein [Ornithinimicrobium sp.]
MSTSRESTPTDNDQESHEPHNQADVAFATDMIPHHAKALRMSEQVLQRDDSTLTDFARQIEDAQQPEIESLSQWLRSWGEDVPATDTTDGQSEEMDDLTHLSGEAFDVSWLEKMTEHHRRAIEMAQTQVAEGRAPAALALANHDIESQQDEIDTMERMAAELRS